MTFKSNLTQHSLYNNKDNISFSEKTQTNGIESRFHSKINGKAQASKSGQSKVPQNFLGTRSVSKQATSNSNVVKKRGAPLIFTPNMTGKMSNSSNSVISKGLPAITEGKDDQGFNAQQHAYANNFKPQADKILLNRNKISDVKEDNTIDFMPQTQDAMKYYLDREITYQKTAHNPSPNPENLGKNIQDNIESTNSDSDISGPEISSDSSDDQFEIEVTDFNNDKNRDQPKSDYIKNIIKIEEEKLQSGNIDKSKKNGKDRSKLPPKLPPESYNNIKKMYPNLPRRNKTFGQNLQQPSDESKMANKPYSSYIIRTQTPMQEDKYPGHGLTSSLDTGTTTPPEKAPGPNSNGSPLEALPNQRKDIGPLQPHNASDFLKETTQNSSLSAIPEETSDLSSDEFSSEPPLGTIMEEE